MGLADVPKPPLILIVDDEDHNVALLETMLSGQGYATIAAHKIPSTAAHTTSER